MKTKHKINVLYNYEAACRCWYHVFMYMMYLCIYDTGDRRRVPSGTYGTPIRSDPRRHADAAARRAGDAAVACSAARYM